MSKCDDCGQEAWPTYCQHIKNCEPYKERILLGKDLPKRTVAGARKSDRQSQKWEKRPSVMRSEVRGKPGRPRTRLPGTPQRRDPNAPCSGCKAAMREPGDTYCAACRKVKNAEAKRRQREYNRIYQSTRNGNKPALKRIG